MQPIFLSIHIAFVFHLFTSVKDNRAVYSPLRSNLVKSEERVRLRSANSISILNVFLVISMANLDVLRSRS